VLLGAGNALGDQVTAQELLGYNETQQLILVKRLAESNKEAIEDCAPGLSSKELVEYFKEWAETYPGYLTREVSLAFTAAILDRCKEEEVPEEKTRRDKIEAGGWTLLPHVPGLLTVRVYDDYTFRSDDPDNEINVLFTDTRVDTALMFARQLYLEIGVAVAPTGEPDPSRLSWKKKNGVSSVLPNTSPKRRKGALRHGQDYHDRHEAGRLSPGLSAAVEAPGSGGA
jgi:hypothetical protein